MKVFSSGHPGDRPGDTGGTAPGHRGVPEARIQWGHVSRADHPERRRRGHRRGRPPARCLNTPRVLANTSRFLPMTTHPRWTTRAETAADIPAVHGVELAAFPSADEAELVSALRRDPAWIEGLSVVTTAPDGTVVGHALLTRCHIDDVPALCLAPCAVLPAHQRTGAGSRRPSTITACCSWSSSRPGPPRWRCTAGASRRNALASRRCGRPAGFPSSSRRCAPGSAVRRCRRR